MPFCVKCGNRVGESDIFCGKCGTRQAVGAPAGPPRPVDPMSGISDRNAALLCYIPMVGWIAAIVVLASERFRRSADPRFHAFQGLYLFVAWLIVDWVLSPALYFADWHGDFPTHHLLPRLLQLLIFAAWILMIVKVSHGEKYKLPIVGELAERSVTEQRS
jgi:uncharacterized membrane protein